MAQQEKFRAFLKLAQEIPEALDLKPKFEKLKPADIARYNEAEALSDGAFLEAIIEKGQGEDTPKEGDLVYFHFSVHPRGKERELIYSTRPEEKNGNGCPLVAILNKSPRLPRGWELALAEMHRSERRVLELRPEMGFQHPDCEYHLPQECADAEKMELSIDIQLVDWYDASKVMSVASATLQPILKTFLGGGEGYENPRPPYKVDAAVCIRRVAENGVRGKGEVIYGSMESSMELTMGDDRISVGVSSCLGSMVKKERAVYIVSVKDLMVENSMESLFPSPPSDLQQVEIEIEILNVIQVRDLYGDGNVMKHRLKDGEGTFPSDCPIQDCKVVIHYKARPMSHPLSSPSNDKEPVPWIYNTRQQSSDPISIDLGFGDMPYGLEGCIHLMLPGEVSLVKCKAEAAYEHRMTQCVIPNGLSKSDDIEFEVELISFEKGMEWAGISTAESLVEARKMKERSNKIYLSGGVELASNKYRKIAQQLNALQDFESDDQVKEAEDLIVICYKNLASCSIQTENYTEAVEWCNKALKIDEQNGKVLLRRGKAYSMKGDYEEAEEDFEEAKNLDASLQTEAEEAILKNKKRKKDAILKQKQQFGKFFND